MTNEMGRCKTLSPLNVHGEKRKTQTNKQKTPQNTHLYLICIWVLINFHVFLSFLISREQQSNSSKIKRNQLHVRPAPGHIGSLTKPTSASVFRRPLKFLQAWLILFSTAPLWHIKPLNCVWCIHLEFKMFLVSVWSNSELYL